MEFLTILLLAVSLAIDAFTVAIAVGIVLTTVSFRQTFRIGFHFGFFQFFMPIIGWLIGINVVKFIEAIDHWIAFGLLSFIGCKMIRDVFRSEERKYYNDPSQGWNLIVLSIATSIDALMVGISLALINSPILYPATVIGIITMILSTVGILFGPKLGKLFKKYAVIFGGIILIIIGIRILASHL
ncbi:MAG: manganese efflux pump [bacterium]|nr:MAG: manganese efflux pump [bacterium]